MVTTTEAVPAPRHTAILVTLAVAGLGGALQQSMVSPALPQIAQGLGTTTSQATWTLTAVLISAAVSTPIIGKLGDAHGVKRVLTVVLALVAIGLGISALASSLGWMIVGRFLQGFSGGVFPLSFSALRKLLPVRRVPGAVGFLSGTVGIGAGFGVVLSGIIVDSLGFRFLFWIPLLLQVATILGVVWFIPADRGAPGIRISWASAALMGASLSVLLYAISEAADWGWTSPTTLGMAALGVALAAAWVAFELRSDTPLVDMRTLRRRAVWATDLTGVFMGAALFGAFILIPQYAQSPADGGFGFSASVTVAGLLLLPHAVTMLIIGPFAGVLRRALGPRMPIILGAIAALSAYLLLLLAPRTMLLMAVASALLGVGVGSAYSAMANVIIDAVPPEETGVSTGVNTVARQIGNALGSSLAATILAASALAGGGALSGGPTEHGYENAFALGAVYALLAIVAGFLIPQHIPLHGSYQRWPGAAPDASSDVGASSDVDASSDVGARAGEVPASRVAVAAADSDGLV